MPRLGEMISRQRPTCRPAARALGLLTGLALAGFGVSAGQATAAIPNGPILRVLRQSDVPRAKNQYLPSGALPVRSFVRLSLSEPSAQSTLGAVLRRHQFRSGAISLFTGPGSLRWQSTAALFASSGAARDALNGVTSATRADVGRTGAIRVLSVDGLRGRLLAVTSASGASEGYVAIVVSGAYICELEGVDTAHRVPAAVVERLLGKVVRRHT